MERIRVAGLFHDIGKIGVPDAILLKNGPLTSEEYDQIKLHPASGEKILSTYSPFKDTLPIIRSHHERIDGSGYPDGLTGDKIDIGAKIIAVADSFDAMVSNRTYRRGLSFDTAMGELIKGIGRQFESEIVDAFRRLIEIMGREEFERIYCAHTCDAEK